MTRPRSTYDYATQRVGSPSGALTLSSEGTRVVVADSGERWSVRRKVFPKQLFIGDAGRAAILGADDVLTFYDARGAITATCPLLETVDESLVSFTTAGRSWDDYLAGTFGDELFVVDGRGTAPLVFTPHGSRLETDAEAVLRARARSVLAEALAALKTRHEGWREPWVFAAIGWARVVGRLAIDATDLLREIGALPLRIHAYTSAGLRAQRAQDDPILVDRWALDPLRQAAHLALLRSGVASDLTTLQIGRKGRMQSTDWVELDRPATWTEGLAEVEIGTSPSGVLADHGTPTHVDSHDEITWSYAWLRDGDPVMTNLTWDKHGVSSVVTIPLPEPTPRGLVA